MVTSSSIPDPLRIYQIKLVKHRIPSHLTIKLTIQLNNTFKHHISAIMPRYSHRRVLVADEFNWDDEGPSGSLLVPSMIRKLPGKAESSHVRMFAEAID